MTSEKTGLGPRKDPLQGALDAVNKPAQGACGMICRDCAAVPLDSRTGEPVFSVPAEGWGTGWAAGGAVRLPLPGSVEVEAEIAPCDDLPSLPGVQS